MNVSQLIVVAFQLHNTYSQYLIKMLINKY